MIRIRSARPIALALPTLLCACGAIFGGFDDLLPPTDVVDAGDENERDAGDENGRDAGVTDAPTRDTSSDVSSDALDGNVAADAGPNRWEGSMSPYILQPSTFVFTKGGRIAALSRIESVVDTFAISFSNAPWSTGWMEVVDGAPPWNDPYSLDANGATFVPGGSIAAVSPDPSWIYVFALDQLGMLYQAATWRDIASPHWQPPATPVQPASDSRRFMSGGSIAAVAFDAQNVEVLSVAPSGYLAAVGEKIAGTWVTPTWFMVADAPGTVVQAERFKAGGGLAAVATDSEHLKTFVIGTDGTLWSAGERQNGTWLIGRPLTGISGLFAPGSEITATYIDGLLETWVIGPDQQLWNAGTWDGVAWQLPYKVAVPDQHTFVATGGLSAAVHASGALELYTIGVDLHLWRVARRAPLGAADR